MTAGRFYSCVLRDPRAIREYQTQLIQRLKDDMETLHEKSKVQYNQTKACKMSHVRDLPPVSGSTIWAKQIDRQLTAYMRRVEEVLGKGWANHVEGQKLKAHGDSFRAKLNTRIRDDWASKVQQRNFGVSGRILAIENIRPRSGHGIQIKLKVNFLPKIIQLSKEVRNLRNLGVRVPLVVVNKANQLDPFAISLIESLRTYEPSLEKMEARPNITLLAAGLRKDVQQLVTEGCAFRDILNKIQKAVDDLSLHAYSNLHVWVANLDEPVEIKLAGRLDAGIRFVLIFSLVLSC